MIDRLIVPGEGAPSLLLGLSPDAFWNGNYAVFKCRNYAATYSRNNAEIMPKEGIMPKLCCLKMGSKFSKTPRVAEIRQGQVV